MNLTSCPECGGVVARTLGNVDVHVGRRTVSLSGTYDRCQGACGEIFYAPGEMDAVMKRASAAIRAEEGMLTPSEIKSIRTRLGISQNQFEELLGAGPKTVVRWERGTVIQNGATNTLLTLLRDVPEAMAHLLLARGIETKVVPLVPAARPVLYSYISAAGADEELRGSVNTPMSADEKFIETRSVAALERIA